jgi:acylphosphatase
MDPATQPPVVRRVLRVTGRVQGVGFRWFVRREATALRLCGAVWNDPEGDVLVDVEGEPAALAALEQRVRVGPPMAKVTAVAVREAEPTGRTSFEVAATGGMEP